MPRRRLMSSPDSTFAPERPPPDPDLLRRVESVNRDLMKFVRQIRTASGPVRAKLQQDMRERLESERQVLLGAHRVLPETLRHYAVTFTEVQWMLDAWIAATAHEAEDRHELRRDFLDVAARMLGEMEVLRAPDPADQSTARRPGWWSAITRGLRTNKPAASKSAPDSGLPDGI